MRQRERERNVPFNKVLLLLCWMYLRRFFRLCFARECVRGRGFFANLREKCCGERENYVRREVFVCTFFFAGGVLREGVLRAGGREVNLD